MADQPLPKLSMKWGWGAL